MPSSNEKETRITIRKLTPRERSEFSEKVKRVRTQLIEVQEENRKMIPFASGDTLKKTIDY